MTSGRQILQIGNDTVVSSSPHTHGFLPWQPSTWPDPPAMIDANFICVLERILKESILDEIGNVIEDAKKSNNGLQHRGHVVGLALMCSLDAISAYGYRAQSKTYMADFISKHFPPEYKQYAGRFYHIYRASLVHSWNLFEATLFPGNESICNTQGVLSFGLLHFFGALNEAVEYFLGQLKSDAKLQANVLTRYTSLKKTARS